MNTSDASLSDLHRISSTNSSDIQQVKFGDEKILCEAYAKCKLSNDISAYQFLNRAYVNGNILAKNFMSSILFVGYQFVAQDVDKAEKMAVETLQWMFVEASSGNIGRGLKQHVGEALKWLTLASEQDCCYAQDLLGQMYCIANGVTKNRGKARELFVSAANKGYSNSQYYLGLMHKLLKNHEEAMKWLQLAADQGHTEAQFSIGTMYDSLGNEWNALKFFELAAQKGHLQAQYYLATMWTDRGKCCCYLQGLGIEKDESEAIKWFLLAAKQGMGEAQYNLGLHFGRCENYEEGVTWTHLAADQGIKEAQYNLGYAYDHGRGVEQDESEAIKWHQLAAIQGDMDAQFILGVKYKNGSVEVDRNEIEAEKWFRKAAEQGHQYALESLENADSFDEALVTDVELMISNTEWRITAGKIIGWCVIM